MKKYQKGSSLVIVLVVIIIVLLGIIGYGYFVPKEPVQQGSVNVEETPISSVTSNTVTQIPGWKKYSDNIVEFEYPSNISAKREGDLVRLNHSIAYKHADACDFKGDSKPLETFTDFNVSFRIINKGVKEAVESVGAFPGWEYVSQNPSTLASLKGYEIMVGAEGCGRYEYYLSLSPSKTLVVHRTIITELSGATGNQQTYLKLPGVIAPEQEKEILTKIFSTFKLK